MQFHSWLTIPLFFLLSSSYTNAFTWQFTSQPRQCQNVSIAVQGSGQPPYSLLIVPTGPSPLPNNTEIRDVQNIPFPGSSTSLTFQLNYPANSSFVAVVSDSSGFGTGGTSTPVAVLQSSDSSCFNPTQAIELSFFFFVDPSGGITQCESLRWFWQKNSVNGTVKLRGVIPGGNSFDIPQGPLSTNNLTGTGFNWTADVRGGTAILIVGGDDRGFGSGGVAPFTVAYSANSSCLNSTSPSSTAGSPAGGSYPTSLNDSSNNPSSRKSSNTGAIAGGIAGGLVLLVAIALLAFFYPRRPRYAAISKERPVNVLHDEEDDNRLYNDLPHYYAPQPYLLPDPNIEGAPGVAPLRDRPLPVTPANIPLPQTPTDRTAAITSPRKSSALTPLRPVNIIQHDDAGPSDGSTSFGEPETIELPPAYTHIRSAQRSPGIVPAPISASTKASTPTAAESTTS